MTVEETAAALNLYAKLIAEATPEMAQEAATSAASVIRDRLQNQGEDANEVQLRPYNPEYKEFKTKYFGYVENFTNLTLTGEMFGSDKGTKNIDIISSGQGAKGYEVIVGGKTSTSQQKINWNSERYGDILRVSKKEENELQAGIDEKLEELKIKAGL
jgi:hypothetical protein